MGASKMYGWSISSVRNWLSGTAGRNGKQALNSRPYETRPHRTGRRPENKNYLLPVLLKLYIYSSNRGSMSKGQLLLIHTLIIFNPIWETSRSRNSRRITMLLLWDQAPV